MARISLKCGCGWNFFVPGSTQGHEAPCPNCGNAVPIPGRTASGEGPKAPGVIAAEKQAKQKQIVLLVSIAAAILLVAVVLMMATSGGPRPVDDDESARRPIDKPRVQPPPGMRKPVVTAPAEPPPSSIDPKTPLGPNREAKIEEHRQAIRVLVWRLNLAGIAGESLRLRGHLEAFGQLQERMKTWEAKVAEALAQLLELGDRFAVEAHVQPGDRVVAFAQKDFGVLASSKIDQELLSPWLRAFRAGQPLEQLVLLRGTQKIELFLTFPVATEDLQEISRLPDVAGPGRYEDGPGAPSSVFAAPLAPALLKEIETRFQAIPAGYRQLLPAADSQKLDQLLKSRAGTPDDQGFLQNRILAEALPGFEREAALVRAKAAELELKVKETTAVDVVHFKDGRKVSGQVLEANEQQVKLKSRLGSMTVPAADVARIERGKGAGVAFPAKLAAAPRTPTELSRLLAWCQDNSLKVEAEYTATLLLGLDPLHEGARRAAGLPARPAAPKSSGGPGAPAPGAGTLGAPAGADPAIKAMDLLAAEVVGKNPSFADVIERMRTGSIGLVVASAPIPSPRATRAVSLIQDPLTFSLAKLDAAGALEIGQWWGAQSPDDRREFARFFGLWCAQRRSGR